MTTEKPITNGADRSLARFNLWLVLALALTLWVLNLHLNQHPPGIVLQPQPVVFPSTISSWM